MSRTLLRRTLTAAAFAASSAMVVGFAPPAGAEPPGALPAVAPDADRRWQPALDFDSDGCYSTPAISPDGTLNPGLATRGALDGGCRDRSDLAVTNTYSRARCRQGWCAFLYGYYFEKDQVLPGLDCCGHRHDWEHIVVWVEGDALDGRARYVSVSQHSGWETRAAADVRWQGDHPKAVYHKDGVATHCFRFATSGDEPPENHEGDWRVTGLIGWDDFPSGVRDILAAADFGAATFKLTDARFADALTRAKPPGVPFGTTGRASFGPLSAASTSPSTPRRSG